MALIPPGFGNRRSDAFGNSHTKVTPEGMPVFRNPGQYRGRHRAEPRPPWWVSVLARLVGERV